MRRSLSITMLLAATAVFAGCDRGSVQIEEVNEPLDGSVAADQQRVLPPGHPALPPTGSGMDMRAQQLPQGAMSDAGTPDWKVPEGWQQGQASSVRRGSYIIPTDAGDIDVSVTVFPGDVGGLLSNVNRWRGQVGLQPVNANDLEGLVESFDVDGHEGTVVNLVGDAQATTAVSVAVHGSTWFFKMTGPKAAIPAAQEAFLAFVASTDFHAE